MTTRDDTMRAFLHGAGWEKAVIDPLPGDASTRRYARVSLGDRTALVMDQPQNAESPTAAADASAEQRRQLGYNAVARLAGADCARFVAVSEFLRAQGLSAPQIYAADTTQGFLLIEDLGNDLYADILLSGRNESDLYETAAEVIARLHAEPAPKILSPGMPLHAYDETALLAETDLLMEWYFPFAMGRDPQQYEFDEHRGLWRKVLAPIINTPAVFVHRDYHAQNLIWLPRRTGPARAGLIDFQDAVAGSRAYDLISLTEDARRDVSPEIAALTTQSYLDAVRAQGNPVNAEEFGTEMAIMAAQRNAKIVGIFARLHKRDGKSRYLSYLPRVWTYLNRDLGHPALTELSKWYDQAIPRSIRTRDA